MIKNTQHSASTIAKIKQKSGITTAGRFIKPKIRRDSAINPSKVRMIKESVSAILNCQFNKRAASSVLGISEQALFARLRNHPEIEEMINQYNQHTVTYAKKRIESQSLYASDKVVKLMESDNERMQLDAATQVLDRAGIVKPVTSNVQVNVLNDLRKDRQEFDL